MDLTVFLPLLFSIIAGFLLLLFVVVAFYRKAEQPGAVLPPESAAPVAGGPGLGLPAGRWNGEILGSGADVSITWPTGSGRWHSASVYVSRERINRIIRNDFEDLRVRAYAHEFVACLAAHGARASW
jgi:hypothetical protein